MIQSFTIENFKSYKKAELKLAPLTVMVGANASGKSNAIEAIRFLSWMAQGQKLSSLQFEVNQNNAEIRGQIKDVFKSIKQPFGIGCAIEDGASRWDVNVSLDLREGKELHINRESMTTSSNVILYETVKPSVGADTKIVVAYNDFTNGVKKPEVTCSDQLGIFTQFALTERISSAHKKSRSAIPIRAFLTENMLSHILFLDPSPQSMRNYSFISDAELMGNGRNISAVLFNLIKEDAHQKINILKFIKSLPEQDISDIGFIETPRDEVMVTLTETFGNESRKMDAGVLSDGTLRVLAIAAALLSAPEQSIVIIEEIDNGVHPSRAKLLLNQINKIAVERKLRIVLSTHNPALMDALPSEVIPDVVFCYRDKQDGSSKLVSLKDVPDYPELIAQGSLGDLVTEGLLSRFVKDYEGSEAKKEKALKWLESIK
ncbi:putative ATPase [Algoriphagus sp. 4150]|uniref:AAA family ATPase n=1 Tax=Algoriphagus sp. 4150 TaxID=2817756 RepID=UPI00285E0072|nr:AAA family ATPase [Algoriphagus sp. 4150]MDR7132764.1 putative ATPase [Algoriphagus sp. 4150]